MRWPLFLALLLPYLLSNFYRAFLAAIAGDLRVDPGLEATALANLQAAFLLAFAAVQIPVGIALDRVGPRPPLVLGLASAVVGSLLFSVAGGATTALGAMVLMGAGFGPVLMTGFYVLARVLPPARFAASTSLLYGIGSLGDPLSGAPLAAARAVVSIRALWFLVPLSLVSYAVIAATRGLWIAPYLAGVHGMGREAVSLGATAMGFAIAGGALLYAPLNRFFGDAKRTVAFGLAVTAVGWLALGIGGAGSAVVAIALLLFVGLFGAHFAIVISHARTLLPAHLLGLGVTLVNLVFFGGAALVQWFSGRYVGAAEAAGVPPPLVYGRLFGGFGIALLVALAVYAFAPAERRRLGP